MTTNLARKVRLRQERIHLRVVTDEPVETVTRMDTTHNGRLVPMTLPKVKWLDRADKRIKALDSLRK